MAEKIFGHSRLRRPLDEELAIVDEYYAEVAVAPPAAIVSVRRASGTEPSTLVQPRKPISTAVE